jgi:hypothetical protein
MGPVGWALLGMGAVMGLVATNTFGLRDAFAGFFGALPEADAATDGARTAIDGLGASATGARDRAAEAQQDITKDMGTLSSNVGSSVETSKAALVGLQNQFSETSATSSSSMANLAASTSTHASSIESAAQRAEAALARLGGLPSNIQLPAAGTPFNAAVPALQAQMMDPAQIPAFKEFLAGYDSKKQVLLREKATNQAILDRPWESAYNRSNARKRIAGIDEELAGLIDRKNYAEQQLAIRDYLMTQLPPAGLGETATIRDSITVELKLGDQALERVTTEVDRRLARRR